MRQPHSLTRALSAAALFALFIFLPSEAQKPAGSDGLLFSLTGSNGLNADYARGQAQPNFSGDAVIAQDKTGRYLRAGNKVTLAWLAAGNIYAERGTLSFDWRARTPLGAQPFPIFRVSFADHTSWDMVWLRIDWNGHGFDAFVTDTSLARMRVSWKIDKIPPPDQWMHIAFGWDEAQGIRLYVNGRQVAKTDQQMDLDTGLDQFGPNARIISPMQVQSNFQFERGTDFRNVKIFDHMLKPETISAIASGKAVIPDAVSARSLQTKQTQQEWLHRFGWDRRMPIALEAAQTVIRKVAFKTTVDVKERMTAGNDGINETTWPGVYNRSSLPGRHDYFELPDWNVYAEGGKVVRFALPDEPFNHIEFLGAAYGKIFWGQGGAETQLASRPEGLVRASYDFATRRGGTLRFVNNMQEMPVREFQAYDIRAGKASDTEITLQYHVNAAADPADYPSADEVRKCVRGRYPADEAALAVALPDGAPTVPRTLPAATLPMVHIVIPGDFAQRFANAPNAFHYSWGEMRQGLDGIVLHIPALPVKALKTGLYPLNIQVKDPIWPGRNLLDVSVSVKPGEARTVFLDTRDRFLPTDGALYLSVAGGGAGLDVAALNGMQIDLKFKPRAGAMAEHVADRLAQIRDNAGFLVEEYTGDVRFARAERLEREFASLFAADPENTIGRQYYALFHPAQPWPAIKPLPPAPAGVPLWAYLQTEDLKLVQRYVAWWIDHRQSGYGDFGGGISDDDDLTHQWPPLALMGGMPDKIRASLSALADSVDKNHMITNGLGTIETDYLHTYEEGINARSDDLYLNWGSPKVLERLMQTARAYPRIIKAGADGHLHIISQLYSGTRVVTEGPWGWSHPYSYLILHPAYDLAGYNANPAMSKLITGLADGYLALGQKKDGRRVLPEMVNGNTGAVRGVLTPTTRGLAGPVQLLLAAERLTGQASYFSPLEDLIGQQPYPVLKLINPDVAAAHADWLARLLSDAGTADQRNPAVLTYEKSRGSRNAEADFDRFYAWRKTGDAAWLEKAYEDEIASDRQLFYMMTEGEWWSDRVELPSDLLQRSRLGGLVLKRNQEIPGHLVSWRFTKPGDAERIAILIHDPEPDSFTVEAYNLSDHVLSADMTGWNIAPGTWQITQAGNPDRTVRLEASLSVPLRFAPHTDVRMQFRRIAAGEDPRLRPDVGIDPQDVVITADTITVRVHSLGNRASPQGRVDVLDAGGKVLESAAMPSMAAPWDNRPVTAQVVMKNPGHVAAVSLSLPEVEITQQNNNIYVIRDSQNRRISPH